MFFAKSALASRLIRHCMTGLYRDIESSTDARRPLSLPQRLAPNHKLAGGNSALPCIRYGRTVRFQADDGGYLLMERDGILRKAPPEFRNDPRTMLTLFPMDPRLSTSKKRVRRDDCAFVVQGAAPMYSRHGAQLAVPEQIDQSQNDTDTSLERGPRSLVATAEVRQHHAARIIVRFLQNTRRYDSAPDRAREFLRRRWRERNPERYRSRLLELTNDQQLRVLQLYNPHLYGSRLSIPPLATAAATSVRLSQTPHMEQTQRLMQQQRQVRIDQATALLKESCDQKTQTPLSATVALHEMYKRRPFTSPDRSRHLHGHEGAHYAHVRVARSSPPSFHYGSLAQVRPQLPRSAMGLPRQERTKGPASVTLTQDHNA
ncbi:hypothetical protein BBJ28_00013758 [Nothophytophthora sp. Chile5]|nr:hypothetical protein BBJ28_00013758 [Nothophytophthora sp. Chile5]